MNPVPSDCTENGRYVDLHLHTAYSDGSDVPRRVVERARNLGIAVIAITDHDTVAGVAEGAAAARELGVAFLPGVEISAEFSGREIHVLGLGIDVDCARLRKMLDGLLRDRAFRADQIIGRLNALGVPVRRDAVAARARDGGIGRMHIAQEVLALGHATTVQDAFDRFLKSGRRAFVRKKLPPCRDAINVIHEAGGLAFLAHPGVGTPPLNVNKLLDLPFDGIEAFHAKHRPDQTACYLRVADEGGLLVTGGSDCHGTSKGRAPEMGKVRTPYRYFGAIRDRLRATVR